VIVVGNTNYSFDSQIANSVNLHTRLIVLKSSG